MLRLRNDLTPAALLPRIARMWELSAAKILAIEETFPPDQGAPVITVEGRYTSRGWTEWTQGFQFGSALLQFDATGETRFLTLGRDRTRERMAPHVTHFGVHDHGFNNVSTYGTLWRLMREGRLPEDPWECAYYELALRSSGAVQARRWTPTSDGGFIHSFNGPHSLFADTIRSLRSLALAHRLGQPLWGEHDVKVSLLERLLQHAATTTRYAVFHGERRDAYDVRGRVAHESIFNVADGVYRCPGTQQGYSPFTTWTRGLAWIMLGAAELLELPETAPEHETLLKAARATCDYYLEISAADGVPPWDTGAPGLARLGDYLDRPSDPFNEHEPVDSSAAAIAAQGLLRLGRVTGEARYTQAGLTVLATLLEEPYLSARTEHQGLLLHSVYHRPRGWDYVPPGSKIPHGESSMWGDYHLREAALLVQRLARQEPYLTFFGPP